jgi:hypothetical protein
MSSMCPVVGLKGFWCQVVHKTLLHVIAFAGKQWMRVSLGAGGGGEGKEGGVHATTCISVLCHSSSS